MLIGDDDGKAARTVSVQALSLRTRFNKSYSLPNPVCLQLRQCAVAQPDQIRLLLPGCLPRSLVDGVVAAVRGQGRQLLEGRPNVLGPDQM